MNTINNFKHIEPIFIDITLRKFIKEISNVDIGRFNNLYFDTIYKMYYLQNHYNTSVGFFGNHQFTVCSFTKESYDIWLRFKKISKIKNKIKNYESTK